VATVSKRGTAGGILEIGAADLLEVVNLMVVAGKIWSGPCAGDEPAGKDSEWQLVPCSKSVAAVKAMQ